jgi:hypothetical protein
MVAVLTPSTRTSSFCQNTRSRHMASIRSSEPSCTGASQAHSQP